MIVSLHVATGAAAGALVRSRAAAVPVGLALHFLGDLTPHEDIEDERFEMVSGALALALLAARRGLFDAAVVGGAAASSPDLEHKVRLPRPRGRKLFPTHRWDRLHQVGGLSARVQLVAAGFLLGLLLASKE